VPITSLEKAIDGLVHVGQEERIAQLLEARLQEGFDRGRVIETSVHKALGQQRRNPQLIRQLPCEQRFRRRQEPAEFHVPDLVGTIYGKNSRSKAGKRKINFKIQNSGCGPRITQKTQRKNRVSYLCNLCSLWFATLRTMPVLDHRQFFGSG